MKGKGALRLGQSMRIGVGQGWVQVSGFVSLGSLYNHENVLAMIVIQS